MTEGLRPSLLQTLPFAALLVVLAIVLRRRGRTRADLRLVWPPAATTIAWVAAFAAYAAVIEIATRRLGWYDVTGWGDRYGAAAIAVRVVGMVLLAPIAEELVFRGLLVPRLARTRLGAPGAVVVAAALFAALHFASPVGMLLIFLDGCFFGAARVRTDSLLLPMLLHALGNAYAAAERLLL